MLFDQASHSGRHHTDPCTASPLDHSTTRTVQQCTDQHTKQLTDPRCRRTNLQHNRSTSPHQQCCTFPWDTSRPCRWWTQEDTRSRQRTVRYTMQTSSRSCSHSYHRDTAHTRGCCPRTSRRHTPPTTWSPLGTATSCGLRSQSL